MAFPSRNCALFISSQGSQDSLLNQLLNLVQTEQCVPSESSPTHVDIDCHPLRLDNKYYEGCIDLCPVTDSKSIPQTVIDNLEAAIIKIDKVSTSIDYVLLDWWANNLVAWDADLLLCVCEKQPTNQNGEKPLLQWCIKNGFELIELDPDADFVKEAEDLGEKIGLHRLFQALQSHPWPSMKLKASKLALSRPMSASNTPDRNTPRKLSGESTSNGPPPKADDKVLPTAKDAIQEVSGVEDPGGVSFEELFDKFASFKTQADSMPSDERKVFAENVTKEFWKAVGGDESEIDLSDSDK